MLTQLLYVLALTVDSMLNSCRKIPTYSRMHETMEGFVIFPYTCFVPSGSIITLCCEIDKENGTRFLLSVHNMECFWAHRDKRMLGLILIARKIIFIFMCVVT